MPNWLSFSTANDMITAALLLVSWFLDCCSWALSLQINSNRGHGKSLTVNGRCSAKGSFGDGNQGYPWYADRVILTCRL